MNRKVWKQAFAIILAVILTLSLCACTQTIEQLLAKAEAIAFADSGDSVDLPDEADEESRKSTEEASAQTQSGKASLVQLREKLSGAPVMFAAAYLGYVGGLFDNGFEQEFPAWLEENNKTLLTEYPFIGEIDGEHIIGGAGHLYCIVPLDENATISVNRVKLNESTQTNEVTEVLYRAETGEPLLLFANLNGDVYEADTQVFITDNNGDTCEWHPSLDEEGYLAPCITGDAWDFTDYQSGSYGAAEDLSLWLEDGWLGTTALSLSGSEDWGITWSVLGTAWDTGRNAYFTMTFYPGDETGGKVDLDWLYEGKEEFEEQWSGFWTIETEMDMPSYITLSLSLVGGKGYDTKDGSRYIAETYRALISPSGEELLISNGENGICLPFMSQSATVSVLELPKG